MVPERKDFSQMSPQEFNPELNLVLSFLPPLSLLVDDIFSASSDEPEQSRIQQRANSEMRSVLNERFKELLFYSFLLPSTRELLAMDFDFRLVAGVNDETFPKGLAFELLELDSEKGGSFSEERAKGIDRTLIRYYSRQGFIIHGMLEKLRDKYGEEPDIRPGKPQLVAKARQDFIEKYGDEP